MSRQGPPGPDTRRYSFPMPLPQIQSVVDALEDLTAAETVAGYRPFPGSQPVSATKTLRLQTLPYLLTLHLMRFEFGGSAGDGANKVGEWPSAVYAGCTRQGCVCLAIPCHALKGFLQL